MVSIRKIRCEFKLYKKQVQDSATIEVQRRADLLLDKLITLSIYHANKRGENSRVSQEDVRLAYLSVIDDKPLSMTEPETLFGDWNE